MVARNHDYLLHGGPVRVRFFHLTIKVHMPNTTNEASLCLEGILESETDEYLCFKTIRTINAPYYHVRDNDPMPGYVGAFTGGRTMFPKSHISGIHEVLPEN